MKLEAFRESVDTAEEGGDSYDRLHLIPGPDPKAGLTFSSESGLHYFIYL